jgi:predicted HicB family RNase H-like nuclease
MLALLVGIIAYQFFLMGVAEKSAEEVFPVGKERQNKVSEIVVDNSVLTQRKEECEAEEISETNEESKSEAEINYEAWSKLFDGLVKLQNEGNKPTTKQVADFKAAFDKLSDEVKLENIPHAQNLFTDVSIDYLTVILFDTKEPKDVLSSIYYDLLNRPEELKMPIIRKLAADKNHPLSEEALDLLVMVDDPAIRK